MRHHRPAPSRALIGLLLATGLLVGSAVVAGTVYKWKDANGQSHYSQQPPDGVKKYDTINGASDAWANGPGAASAASDKHDGATASTKPAAGQTPAQQQRAQLCTQARANVTTLNQHAKVTADINGDGKPVALNAAQHDQALRDANKQVELYCAQ
ncbi:MAG: DUF4124 domain-containing protein [Proteobacteria bacterium]|nr:DUF4124 domain-containing protein [Pseudomonadota bacterium]